MTVREAATELGVTPQTIRRRVHDGTLDDVVKERGHAAGSMRFLIPVREVSRLRRQLSRSSG